MSLADHNERITYRHLGERREFRMAVNGQPQITASLAVCADDPNVGRDVTTRKCTAYEFSKMVTQRNCDFLRPVVGKRAVLSRVEDLDMKPPLVKLYELFMSFFLLDYRLQPSERIFNDLRRGALDLACTARFQIEHTHHVHQGHALRLGTRT